MKKSCFLILLLFCCSIGLAHAKKSDFYDNRKLVNSLKFSVSSLTLLSYEGGGLTPQSTTLTASAGSPAVTFSLVNAVWLKTPPPATGSISFDASNINTNLDPGSYKGMLIASSAGYQSDTLNLTLIIADGILNEQVNVNFQDHPTVPPTNWYRDFGQGFGLRTGSYQSIMKSFGWRKRANGSPLEMTSNGFNRLEPEDVTLATLIYMQANNVTGSFPGSKIEAYWEMKVANGTYDVTVSVGDGKVDNAAQHNYIKVEGVSAITNFVPTGIEGAATRFKQATLRVTVKDELLTINADGGTNTRINFVQITPVTISPFLGMSPGAANLLIKKGNSATQTLPVTLANSRNLSLTYNVGVSYGSGATGWLTFPKTVTGIAPIVKFTYSGTSSLPAGSYTAIIKITNANYTSNAINIQLRVVNTSSPYVISSTPANNDVRVSPAIVSIAANNLSVPVVAGFKGGVDNSTVNSNTVKFYKIVNGIANEVAGVVQGTGGGDAISFSPTTSLLTASTYKLSISNGVKSYSGAAFNPFTAMFVTDEDQPVAVNPLNASFTKVAIPATQGKSYTSVCFGPDDKFYALRLDGTIERYTVNHVDGTLSNQQIISTLTTKYGLRSAIGLVFDPNSTATNLICYVTHSSSGLTNSPSFDGNLSMLSGADLGTEVLFVTKLPRSTRDHMSNSMSFGPDGSLYLSQGSNSSAGAFDNDWQRAESLLSGSILRIDLVKLATFARPLNVQTSATQSVINAAPASSVTMSDGTYNPYSTLSPVTIYASGVRNAYSLLWHSNGQLYVPTNGSGGGGNSPASVADTRRPDGTFYNGPVIPATTGVQVQNDWLFRVNPIKTVGFYGHPNPLRGQYVENRGYLDNPLYATSIVADASYRGYAYNFGLNHSPDGVIEYKSSTFNGVLKNKLLVCRFSGGGDIVVVEPKSLVKVAGITAASVDTIYDIKSVTTGAGDNGLIGMSGFANPLNLVEDQKNGNLYVIEYNWNSIPGLISQITLLKVNPTQTPLKASLNLVVESGVDNPGLISYKTFNIVVSNRGDGDLKVKDIAFSGPAAAQYRVTGIVIPTTVNPLIMKKNTSLLFKASVPLSNYVNKPVKVRVTSMDDTVKEALLVDSAVANKISFAGDSLIKADSLHKGSPAMKVFPNPNKGDRLTIELTNFKKRDAIVLTIYDIKGQKLKTINIDADDNGAFKSSVDLKLAANIHLIVVMADAGSTHREEKVIIQ